MLPLQGPLHGFFHKILDSLQLIDILGLSRKSFSHAPHKQGFSPPAPKTPPFPQLSVPQGSFATPRSPCGMGRHVPTPSLQDRGFVGPPAPGGWKIEPHFIKAAHTLVCGGLAPLTWAWNLYSPATELGMGARAAPQNPWGGCGELYWRGAANPASPGASGGVRQLSLIRGTFPRF